ncbi:hypothetical protein C8024_08360 [Sphingopyxis sp. BSNA05]|nr:hypothetical protein [Sphingopyxis sp. BSNA05]
MPAKLYTGIILGLMGVLAALELALADRKYGLFTGGFGQSQAVDTLTERMIFLAGYFSAMALLLFGIWWIIVRLFRSRRSWPPLFLLVTIAGGTYVLLLALTFQLHQYFSDTMSFALMANLGGGSLTDALLFASNEIVLGLAALFVGLCAYIFLFRLLSRKYPVRAGHLPWPAHGRRAMLAFVSTLLLAIAVPAASADVKMVSTARSPGGCSRRQPTRLPTLTVTAMAGSPACRTGIRSTAPAIRWRWISLGTESMRMAMAAIWNWRPCQRNRRPPDNGQTSTSDPDRHGERAL